jgi:DNA-binding MarR family transcriptional regulator
VDDRLLFLLSRTGHAIKAHVKSELQKNGVHFSPVQMGILFSLRTKDGLPMNEIGRIVQVDNAAITRHVDLLEDGGYVKRTVSPDDRRINLIQITEKGAKEASRCKNIVRRLNDSLKEGFSEDDMTIFIRVLNDLLVRFSENRRQ